MSDFSPEVDPTEAEGLMTTAHDPFHGFTPIQNDYGATVCWIKHLRGPNDPEHVRIRIDKHAKHEAHPNAYKVSLLHGDQKVVWDFASYATLPHVIKDMTEAGAEESFGSMEREYLWLVANRNRMWHGESQEFDPEEVERLAATPMPTQFRMVRDLGILQAFERNSGELAAEFEHQQEGVWSLKYFNASILSEEKVQAAMNAGRGWMFRKDVEQFLRDCLPDTVSESEIDPEEVEQVAQSGLTPAGFYLEFRPGTPYVNVVRINPRDGTFRLDKRRCTIEQCIKFGEHGAVHARDLLNGWDKIRNAAVKSGSAGLHGMFYCRHYGNQPGILRWIDELSQQESMEEIDPEEAEQVASGTLRGGPTEARPEKANWDTAKGGCHWTSGIKGLRAWTEADHNGFTFSGYTSFETDVSVEDVKRFMLSILRRFAKIGQSKFTFIRLLDQPVFYDALWDLAREKQIAIRSVSGMAHWCHIMLPAPVAEDIDPEEVEQIAHASVGELRAEIEGGAAVQYITVYKADRPDPIAVFMMGQDGIYIFRSDPTAFADNEAMEKAINDVRGAQGFKDVQDVLRFLRGYLYGPVKEDIDPEEVEQIAATPKLGVMTHPDGKEATIYWHSIPPKRLAILQFNSHHQKWQLASYFPYFLKSSVESREPLLQLHRFYDSPQDAIEELMPHLDYDHLNQVMEAQGPEFDPEEVEQIAMLPKPPLEFVSTTNEDGSVTGTLSMRDTGWDIASFRGWDDRWILDYHYPGYFKEDFNPGSKDDPEGDPYFWTEEEIISTFGHNLKLGLLKEDIDPEEVEQIAATPRGWNGLCANCGADLSKPMSVRRWYLPPSEEDEPPICYGHYDKEGTFDPDGPPDRSVEGCDLVDDSDVCSACGGNPFRRWSQRVGESEIDPEEVEQVAAQGLSPFHDFQQLHRDVWEKVLGVRFHRAFNLPTGAAEQIVIRVVKRSKNPKHPEAFSITTCIKSPDGKYDKIWRDLEPLANVRRKIELHTRWAIFSFSLVKEDMEPEEVEQLAQAPLNPEHPLAGFKAVLPDLWERDLGHRHLRHEDHIVIRVQHYPRGANGAGTYTTSLVYKRPGDEDVVIWARSGDRFEKLRMRVEQFIAYAKLLYGVVMPKVQEAGEIDPEEVEQMAQARLKKYVVFYVDGYQGLQPIVNYKPFEGFNVRDCELRWKEKYPEARVMRIEPLEYQPSDPEGLRFLP